MYRRAPRHASLTVILFATTVAVTISIMFFTQIWIFRPDVTIEDMALTPQMIYPGSEVQVGVRVASNKAESVSYVKVELVAESPSITVVPSSQTIDFIGVGEERIVFFRLIVSTKALAGKYSISSRVRLVDRIVNEKTISLTVTQLSTLQSIVGAMAQYYDCRYVVGRFDLLSSVCLVLPPRLTSID